MTSGPTIAQIRAGLVIQAELASDAALHLKAFHAWLLDDQEALAELSQTAAGSLAIAGERSARHVAVLGFASAAGILPSTLGTALEEGLSWLSQRTWFLPQRPLTLEADGVAALGAALGEKHIASSRQFCWLQALVVRSAGSPEISEFNRTLFIAAAHVLHAPARQDISEMLPAARVVLAERGIGHADSDCRVATWQHALHATSIENASEAVLLLRAFDILSDANLPARIGQLEPQDVARVLKGVQHSLRRWTWENAPRTPTSALGRWNIENEYHVQNLLWAVLAPLFPDLNDEETLPPVGQKNPRVDLSIPSLGCVVEVKFMRKSMSFQDVIEEIAADASLYGTDPRWTSLIPFVWDDSRRSEEHQKLISGLMQLPMVIDAIVVPRPGKMVRIEDSASPARKRRGQSSA